MLFGSMKGSLTFTGICASFLRIDSSYFCVIRIVVRVFGGGMKFSFSIA